MGQTAATGSIGDIPLDNIDHIEYVRVVPPPHSMAPMLPTA